MRKRILSLNWFMTFEFGSHRNYMSWDNQNILKTRKTPMFYCLRTQGSEWNEIDSTFAKSNLWLLYLVLMERSYHETITLWKQKRHQYLIVSAHKEVNKMILIIPPLKWDLTLILVPHGNLITQDTQNISRSLGRVFILQLYIYLVNIITVSSLFF